MRWCFESSDARLARLAQWRRYFAWHPVKLGEPGTPRNCWAWLTWVEQRTEFALGWRINYYREIV